jgi:hypothetical protein
LCEAAAETIAVTATARTMGAKRFHNM